MTVSVSSFSNFLSLIEAGTWTASDQGTGAFYSGTPPIGSKAYDLSFANRSSDDIKNGTWPKNWILAQEYFKNTQPSYWINSTEIGKEIGSLSKNGQFTSWAESQLPSDSSQTTIKSLALNLENQAWAEASKLYANQATGDVIAFVNGANVGTTDSYTGAVFAQIELPRLLRNQSVTTINGIDREVLVKTIMEFRTTHRFPLLREQILTHSSVFLMF